MSNKLMETLLEIYKEKKNDQLEELLEKAISNVTDEIVKVLDESNSLMLVNLCECLYWIFSLESERTLLLITQLTPVIIWLHYKSLVLNVKEISCSIDALLLAIYNQGVNNQKLKKVSSFQVPNISTPSIYHKFLPCTENAEVSTSKPLPPLKYLDKISALNRAQIIHMVWSEYNNRISLYPESSIISCCDTIIRLSCSGYKSNMFPSVYSKNDIHVLQDYPRFKLNSVVVKDMVSSLYFIIYNGGCELAYSALKCLHEKVSIIVCPESILATKSLLDLFDLSQLTEEDFELMPPLNPFDFKINFRHDVAECIPVNKEIKIY